MEKEMERKIDARNWCMLVFGRGILLCTMRVLVLGGSGGLGK